ncbi:aminodeoxychorismate/anthranilate synthase component II [Cytophagaceae bacterium YF14B1]|uniref:Aminodeoxychorismate/anthranilate synthase component II n=1 Tax=Xanthocytophaga flava TaxID=3048013 RepID=A0AAE3QQ05_9BACT|nr:aminodeoxychorismate/anthranilate synthase component II [Xanthocytophaga flavus]MDJ1483165.1 aminodeoxychorismate/anthranilate synthase component II [Xanthocytophaga flavus]
MFLLLDNFDSFTYNLADYLLQCRAEYHIVRNNVSLEEIIRHDYEGIVLSPGPETPQKAGNLLHVIDYYISRKPILGICLGHQALGQYFGAKLVRAEQPMHGKLSYIQCDPEDKLFTGLPDYLSVVRYHSLILSDLPEALELLAWTEMNEPMAFKHKSLPIRGIQFHPEAALTEYGLQMINNWVNFVRNY